MTRGWREYATTVKLPTGQGCCSTFHLNVVTKCPDTKVYPAITVKRSNEIVYFNKISSYFSECRIMV